jgi:hypothetical protein
MARMLGRSGRDGGGWSLAGSWGLSRKLKHRVERRREQRDFSREVAALPDDLTEGRERRIAQYGWETGEPGYDWSDCKHGCNGDCLTGGSDRCTFVCHGGVVDVDHERAVAYIALFNEADELVRGYVSDLWAEDWRSPEDSEYDRRWP